MLYSDNLRDFLICSNREERLRFNLDDIILDNGYQELLHNLDINHPYSLLVFTIGGITVCHSSLYVLYVLYSLLSHPAHPRWIPQNWLVSQKTEPESGGDTRRPEAQTEKHRVHKLDDQILQRHHVFVFNLVFNLVAWGLDVVGDILGIIFFRSNFLLAMVLNIGVPTGLAPLVYLYGAKGISVFASRKIPAVKTKQNSQQNKSSNGESNM